MLIYSITRQLSFISERIRGMRQRQTSNLSRGCCARPWACERVYVAVTKSTQGAEKLIFGVQVAVEEKNNRVKMESVTLTLA